MAIARKPSPANPEEGEGFGTDQYQGPLKKVDEVKFDELAPSEPATAAASPPPVAAPAPPPEEPKGVPLKRFAVTLKHCPDRVVEAADEAEALVNYFAEFGILKSDHEPAVQRVTDE